MECKYFDDIKKCCLNINTTFYGALCTGVRMTCGAWEPKPTPDYDCLTVMKLDGTPDQTIKATPDQTAKADAGKLELTLVPRRIIREIAKCRMYGVRKYKDPDIWKTLSCDRIRNAAYRHFLSYLDDPSGVDEESGISHLSHLATNIAFLIELESEK